MWSAAAFAAASKRGSSTTALQKYNMSKHISIHEYPIFEKGIFKKHPALFDAYFRNTPDHQKKKYQKARRTLPKYEEQYKWQVINGPGFCGTTHPGRGKIFHGAMTGATHPVYNSDCLYVNPSQNVFAVSDPPGITTFSRDVITRLDELLKSDSVEKLEDMVNEVNRNAGTGLRDRATLVLIHLPRKTADKALILSCGDSHLFLGNTIKQKISRLEAEENRWGTLNAHFKLKQIDIVEGDFFVLASDGINIIRSSSKTNNLDDTILNMMTSDPDNFVYNIALNCNEIIEQETAGQTRTVFGCGDDLSAILIEPAKLQPTDSNESHILGGYVEWKTP